MSPYSGVNFLGRVEVFHNGQWGTICDDYFRSADANVLCRMAGFSGAICTITGARYGRGYYGAGINSSFKVIHNYIICLLTGPIWLDNIGCSTGDEILEDCSRLNWGSYSRYCSHSDDVGVICRPSKISTVFHYKLDIHAYIMLLLQYIEGSPVTLSNSWQ